jgi:hypothetical protein
LWWVVTCCEEVLVLGKPLLFLSSYAPLFALLAIRFQPQWLWICCSILAALGVFSLLLLLWLDTRSEPGPHVLVTVQDAGGEAASYLAGYLLPFLVAPSPSVRDAIAYLGFLLVAAAINLRSAMVQVNPLLYVFGYRILAVADKGGLRAYLITRRMVQAGDKILATRFRDEVLVNRPPGRSMRN